ncbi:hypothetical protein EV643_103318 [Kribbella sp. VKM Ac-2527]|uniref:Acyl-CoA dehydrogenase/oxidase N-terminal domain-containing protein n=1 Tax=Kribbella caucasensis TaxID=2512215 RepID=A0A4R6KPQ1_9ACTN|nr:acyl-CoA dehydrogenase family protein [Kribbella sp. VKM Ac-2527]TDO51579.1 hypothetical protein EV643_103318 [Kribbella sp. VKM Ac-2527]
MSRLQQTEGLTDIQEEILKTVRAFVESVILPVATELEDRDEYPTEIVGASRRCQPTSRPPRSPRGRRLRPADPRDRVFCQRRDTPSHKVLHQLWGHSQ